METFSIQRAQAGEIILWLVRWYGRYAPTYNDLTEMAAERNLFIARSTICRWVHEYGRC